MDTARRAQCLSRSHEGLTVITVRHEALELEGVVLECLHQCVKGRLSFHVASWCLVDGRAKSVPGPSFLVGSILAQNHKELRTFVEVCGLL